MKVARTVSLSLLLAAGVLLVLLVLVARRPDMPGKAAAPGRSTSNPNTQEALGRIDALDEEIKQSADALRKGSSSEREGILSRLRHQLATAPSFEAAAAIRNALQSGSDASTESDLKPSGEGRLASASSLRVFLLDELRMIDPKTAREVAREILRSFTSPDEWAIALAAAASDATPAGTNYLRDKSREMVRHEPWQEKPTAGFLEAFDVFVFTRDIDFTPELARFLNQTNNRALAHAAFLTLDRLVISDPTATLSHLLDVPAMLSSRTATRAGYFARADVREETQRALLERYLLSAELSNAELQQFTGSFPNANYTISRNLLTRSRTPNGAELLARDQAAAEVVTQWLSDPRFRAHHAQFKTIQERLTGWAGERP